jgi:hypothetical protein
MLFPRPWLLNTNEKTDYGKPKWASFGIFYCSNKEDTILETLRIAKIKRL